MPDNKYYYHVTKKNNVQNILEHGLIPMIGENSAGTGENEPKIYLCRRCDIAKWMILINADTVLKIDKHGIKLPIESFDYSEYGEYMTDSPIDSKWISKISPPSKTERLKAMRVLAESHVYTLSYLSCNMLRKEIIYLRAKKDGNEEKCRRLKTDMQKTAKNTVSHLKVMSLIDFKTLTTKEIAGIVREHSNEACYMTFADTYYNKDIYPDMPDAGKRCWEHLANLEPDELKDAGLALHEFIKKNIPGYVRRLPNIGGFAI